MGTLPYGIELNIYLFLDTGMVKLDHYARECKFRNFCRESDLVAYVAPVIYL